MYLFGYRTLPIVILMKVQIYGKGSKKHSSKEERATDKENTSTKYTSKAESPAIYNPDKIYSDQSISPSAQKSEKEIQQEIQAIFRQVTASVTFLPQLDAGNCTFNVLVYADADSEVPIEWGESDAKEIENGEKVQLRSFSTTNHRVDTLVSYR